MRPPIPRPWSKSKKAKKPFHNLTFTPSVTKSTMRQPFAFPTRKIPSIAYWTTKSTMKQPFPNSWSKSKKSKKTLPPFSHNQTQKNKCNQVCLYSTEVVCGSNGLSYPNKCMLENSACQNPDKNIFMECDKECPCTKSTFKEQSNQTSNPAQASNLAQPSNQAQASNQAEASN